VESSVDKLIKEDEQNEKIWAEAMEHTKEGSHVCQPL